MYGPLAITLRPESPGFPSKHAPTSGGIGAVAGIDMRRLKSPVGFVRWKTIVWLSGVEMPEIAVALPFATSSQPLITGEEKAYWPPSFGFARRFIAYATSFDVITRPTGGPNLMPFRSL